MSTMVTANIVLTIGTERVRMAVSATTDDTDRRDILPVARSVCGMVVDLAIDQVKAEGKQITCKAGCGACCRQIVPISQVEARVIADLVAAMPEPRQTQIRERFARAKENLQASGHWQKLLDRSAWSQEEPQQFGLSYFGLGIPCPFLEEESCSIHPDRPITCREYLVTSSAEECAKPTKDTIQMVPLAKKVWPALAQFDGFDPGKKYLRWVPLIMALEWAETHPDTNESRPGTGLVQEFFEHLAGKKVPAYVPFST